jgi:hypothetical protein
MLARRQEALGQPKTLYEQVLSVGVAAGVLLPDLSAIRGLTRAAAKYGGLLADEGRLEEARVFLDAWKTLGVHLNGDAFTLIDVLVVAAIADTGRELAAPVYDSLGDAVRAARTREEAAALAAPVKAWKERRKAAESGDRRDATQSRGGILAKLLLPALGESPTADELAPSRQVEYALAAGVAIAFLEAVMLLVMLVFLADGLIRRVRGSAGILLLPEWGTTARLLLVGVLLPLAAWVAVSRCPALSYAAHLNGAAGVQIEGAIG